ncbi:ras-related C3 botulinum toxin substrate 1-like [Babylonia areolata]|uniref:ras-related C3 botulinum toxin substrate 1-like n=1 Tax=Babylonia areolata TaxID=304850 RepID=UPI003FD22864
MAAKQVKCVVVGDGAVGKSCMLITYTTAKFPEGYGDQPILGKYTANITQDGQTVALQLWDTQGQEDYDEMIPLLYQDTDIFMICFSLMSETSYKNVEPKWYPEICRHAPDAPIVLVGTKLDLRNDKSAHSTLLANKQTAVSTKHGKSLARKIKAREYIECSAITRENLNTVFQKTVRVALNTEGPNGSRSGSSKCVLL